MSLVPKCFISYSHDNEDHKEWVLNLASRLVENGVNVILDQWNLSLGGDLPSFMEGRRINRSRQSDLYMFEDICS